LIAAIERRDLAFLDAARMIRPLKPARTSFGNSPL
jgi:hypothetical protein